MDKSFLYTRLNSAVWVHCIHTNTVQVHSKQWHLILYSAVAQAAMKSCPILTLLTDVSLYLFHVPLPWLSFLSNNHLTGKDIDETEVQ